MYICDKICEYAKALKISDIGFCRARVYDELIPVLSASDTPFCSYSEKRINPFLSLENAKSVIICVFNYYTEGNGNIAKYAHGDDYHKVAGEKLNKLCDMIKADIPSFEGVCFSDNSPMCDKYLAYLGGLGFFGKNSLLISPKYGSYIVIGGILANIELDYYSKPLTKKCDGCKKCISACPSGAISEKGIDAKKCVSYLLQKKGELTEEEKEYIVKSGMVWGCDICQSVCPHNCSPTVTDIEEFKNNTVTNLTSSDTDEAFSDKFKDKAFCWRGSKTLKRNTDLYN